MSKLRKTPAQLQSEANDAVRHEILMNRTDLGLQQKDIALSMGVTAPAVSTMLKDLDSIRIPRLRHLVHLHLISPGTVLRWLGYTDRDIKDWMCRETAGKEV